MQVETYEEKETVQDDEIAAAMMEGEAAMLIESLELEGQKKLFTSSNGAMAPHPYRAMTKEEAAVFGILFPNITEATAYSDGPMPLRILQVISHVKSLAREDMAFIGVMHPEKFVDDPVLFAQKTHWSGTRYILARWGKALEPFEDLKKKAFQKATEATASKLRNIQRQIQMLIDQGDDYIVEEFAKGAFPTPSFHR